MRQDCARNCNRFRRPFTEASGPGARVRTDGALVARLAIVDHIIGSGQTAMAAQLKRAHR